MPNIFVSQSGFCAVCGSILPPISNKRSLTCYCCTNVTPIEEFEDVVTKYTINFNAREDKEDTQSVKQSINVDGPIVDRKCPKCANEKMSYATVQLRSADEGQTVFYTCTKCQFKENENS